MSFRSRLIHTVAIERPQQTVALLVPQYDDYNQPVTEYVSVTEEVAAFISPKRAREVAATTDAGAEIANHVVFFEIDVDVQGIDRLHNADTGEVHEVRGIRSFRFGRSPHHEVDTFLLTASEVGVAA